MNRDGPSCSSRFHSMYMKFTKDKGCKLFFMLFIFCNIYVYLLAASKRGFKERGSRWIR